jgi:hypothetical protein
MTTRPVSYACDPANGYCECSHCQLPPRREIKVDALAEHRRATSITVNFLLLLAALLAFMAIGFANTEEVHQQLSKTYQESLQ